MRHSILFLALTLGLASFATSQNVSFLASVGTPRTIPDQGTGPAGAAVLRGGYCQLPTRRLEFEFVCVPGSWNGPMENEDIIFMFNVGAPVTTPVVVAGGTFWIPLTPNPITIQTGQSRYLGPGDVVGGTCTGFTSFGGPVCSNINYSRNGNGFKFPTASIPSLIGLQFTTQALMIDPRPPVQFYTSNALFATVVP